jgi:hypothetical protein
VLEALRTCPQREILASAPALWSPSRSPRFLYIPASTRERVGSRWGLRVTGPIFLGHMPCPLSTAPMDVPLHVGLSPVIVATVRRHPCDGCRARSVGHFFRKFNGPLKHGRHGRSTGV